MVDFIRGPRQLELTENSVVAVYSEGRRAFTPDTAPFLIMRYGKRHVLIREGEVVQFYPELFHNGDALIADLLRMASNSTAEKLATAPHISQLHRQLFVRWLVVIGISAAPLFVALTVVLLDAFKIYKPSHLGWMGLSIGMAISAIMLRINAQPPVLVRANPD